MNTRVITITEVVNEESTIAIDYGSNAQHSGAVSSLYERMEWVIENRFDGNGSAWSVAAGKSRTHVTTLMYRLRQNPQSGQEFETLRALATAAKVSLSWLAEGVGTPDSYDELASDREDRYPNRAEAISLARRAGYSATAVADIQAMALDADNDPPVRWWLEKIQERDRQLADPFLKPPKHNPGKDI